ncbi:RidA family protein [Phytohabitans houttuyneae]|uniref:Translation initiation inhibitor n=1 Tax=Phytohabitans houttuyneae TaxID=1076126 RepID=A0A6V8JW90_9ACTN|nr:RidA family protein [Phytohabitans houttuyneae]GFJ76923.1 translation initiation inhibitor [Phytohabitans houttuyneae]
MPKEPLVAPGLAPPNGHFSQATVAGPGRFVFISGMTARRADGTIAGIGDITEQTHQVCRNLAAAVEAAGGTLDDIARVDVYVRDIGDFAAIHAVRRRYFTGEPPASTMVEVSRFVHDEYLIEINAIAVLGVEA